MVSDYRLTSLNETIETHWKHVAIKSTCYKHRLCYTKREPYKHLVSFPLKTRLIALLILENYKEKAMREFTPDVTFCRQKVANNMNECEFDVI